MKRRLLNRQFYSVLVFGTLAAKIIEICGTFPSLDTSACYPTCSVDWHLIRQRKETLLRSCVLRIEILAMRYSADCKIVFLSSTESTEDKVTHRVVFNIHELLDYLTKFFQ